MVSKIKVRQNKLKFKYQIELIFRFANVHFRKLLKIDFILDTFKSIVIKCICIQNVYELKSMSNQLSTKVCVTTRVPN